MTSSNVYDKAAYHYEGDYPEDLPPEQAYVHTGMYLGWIIDNDLYSQVFADHGAELIRQFKSRRVTGPRLFERLGGVFSAEMLSDAANAFSQMYFDFDRGRYLKDYAMLFCARLPSIYHVEDTWENYEKLANLLNLRYDMFIRHMEKPFRDAGRAPKRPWWKFWGPK